MEFFGGVVDKGGFRFGNRVVRSPFSEIMKCGDPAIPLDSSGKIVLFALCEKKFKDPFVSFIDKLLNGFSVDKYCWNGYEKNMGVRLEFDFDDNLFVVDSWRDLVFKAREIVNLARDLISSGEKPFVLAAIPNKGDLDLSDDPYLDLKRVFISNGVPEQFVEYQTLSLSGKNLLSTLGTVAYNIHPKAGFRTYTLDGLGEGLEIAWDVSRFRENGKPINVASAIEVFLDNGVYLGSKEFVSPQAGEVTSSIGSFIRDVLLDTLQNREIDLLVLRRDGRIPNEERDVIIKSLNEVSKYYDLPSRIVLISEIKDPSFRIINTTGRTRKGVYVVLGDREIGLLTTGFPEPIFGTPRPLRVVWESIRGEFLPDEIAKMTFLLSELHLASPFRSTRLSMPVHFANKHAYFAARKVFPSENLVGTPWFN